MASKRILWLDFYRAYAVALIVAWHMAYLVFQHLKFSYGFLGVLLESGTMIFVFCSGLLCPFHSDGRFDYSRYILHKAQNIYLPYLIASATIIALNLLRGETFHAKEIVFDFLFGRAAEQLWFVPMIMLFYLAAPLFRWIDRRNLYWGLLILFPLSLLVGRGGYEELAKNTVYFFPFYLLGIFCGRDLAAMERFLRHWRYAVYPAALTLLFLSGKYPGADILQTLGKIFYSTSVLILFQQFTHKEASHWGSRWICRVSFAGLGIYLYHNSFIAIFGAKGWAFLRDVHGEFTAILYLTAGTLLCIGVLVLLLNTAAWFLRKIGFKNTRMLIGA